MNSRGDKFRLIPNTWRRRRYVWIVRQQRFAGNSSLARDNPVIAGLQRFDVRYVKAGLLECLPLAFERVL